jgi:outer membrane protein
MKSFILGLLLLLCSKINFAQTEKGTFALSGKTDLHFLFSQNTYGNDSINIFKGKNSEYGFTLGGGYFIADNFFIGLSATYNYLDTKSEPNQWLPGVEEITSTIGVIPQLSYYFPVKGKLKPSVGGGIGYSWRKVRNSQSQTDDNITYSGSGPAYVGGLGASYFVSRSISFDLIIQYSHNRLKEKSSEWIQKQNAVAGSIGISVYL